jgi:hypothetical protein
VTGVQTCALPILLILLLLLLPTYAPADNVTTANKLNITIINVTNRA